MGLEGREWQIVSDSHPRIGIRVLLHSLTHFGLMCKRYICMLILVTTPQRAVLKFVVFDLGSCEIDAVILPKTYFIVNVLAKRGTYT